MRIALDDLLVDVPAEQVEETRAFSATRRAGRGPSSAAELREARARRSAPTPADPPPAEEMAEAEGSQVPVRVVHPAAGRARGVHLEIHGGGFYLDPASPHGFTGHPTPMAGAALRGLESWLLDRLA